MWLPRMLKVAGSIPGRGYTDLYCARGTQGVLSMSVGGAISQLDLPSLAPLSVAGYGRLQQGVPTGLLQYHYCK